ncbi:unnamed protein product [Fraxinus pennsylvanica]|uniref:Uncharacterized protein n=1 Tax=Fraxinus pennsylvanica TaxID=56036 RepID=A0AAD1Z5M6_9LAMI|nr:unnamed protein product [Fraxinus pennsylvanica]
MLEEGMPASVKQKFLGLWTDDCYTAAVLVFAKPEEDDLYNSGAINLLANLHLNSSTATSGNHQLHPNTITATARGTPISFTRKRSVCGSMKIISQSSSLSRKEALWERATLHLSSSARDGAATTKIPLLSTNYSTPPPPPSSNTLQSFPSKTTQISNPSSQFLNPQSTESSPTEATLPPLCSSDYHMVVAATDMPPRPRRSPYQESPNSKRLKRMNERMKQMNQWCNQVRHEEENKNESEKEAEKAVWVDEINGGDLIIHFKCPCGGAYEILLSGNNCFYKL